jgi:hypothetical protein
MKAKPALVATAVSVIALCAFLSCQRTKRSGPTELRPLTGTSWRTSLDVPGFLPAEVALPLGSRSARPVLIALHGDADRPEWQCGSYRGVVKSSGFILCPRGVPRDDGRFTLAPHATTAAELRVALRQLKAHFGAHVARGDVVLAGLGPSAEQALALAVEEPHFFARLMLVDGSTRALTSGVATRFGHGRGKRVLMLCTPNACDPDVDERVLALRPSGVDTRVVHLPTGAGLDGATASRLAQEWSWLIADDRRWR